MGKIRCYQPPLTDKEMEAPNYEKKKKMAKGTGRQQMA